MIREINLQRPVVVVHEWRVLVRGPAIVLLPPTGPGYEVSRSACWLSWDGMKPEDYDKLTTFTSEPLASAPQVEDAKGKP
jgi:hypothetical protein